MFNANDEWELRIFIQEAFTVGSLDWRERQNEGIISGGEYPKASKS